MISSLRSGEGGVGAVENLCIIRAKQKGDLTLQRNTHGLHSLVGRLRRAGLLLFTVTVASSAMAFAEDVIVLKNGDRISGEVKKLENGDVHIDADYGQNIFIIDWEEVERIEIPTASPAHFSVVTSSGDRLS